MGYFTEYQRAIEQPEVFWADQASHLPWFVPPATVLSNDDNGIERWFSDGEMNTCYMALDHHVAQGRGGQTALIYDSPVTDTQQTWTYAELTDAVATFAGALSARGVGKGDRVVIYMPMVPEALIAMLAVARLGAIHSVVFGGFAAHELALRIDDARPKLVISASCGIEIDKVVAYKPLLDDALKQAEYKPQGCIILQRPQCEAALVPGRDEDWQQAVAGASSVDCVAVNATDPLYILYTSGTTGKPKGVVRDNGGHAVALHYSMSAIYNMAPGDVFWAASDVGWVVGHSYIVYGPLLAGCTTVLYEGKPIKTPDAGAFWRVASEHKVKALFAAPTAFRAIKKSDPDGKLIGQYDLSNLETIFMAGERLDPPTYEWTVEKTGKPVVDHWWQTETGWAICANLTGIENLAVKPGSATVPVPGFNVQILDPQGQPLPAGQQGAIAIQRPLPPGCLPTIWGCHDRFVNGYLREYPGFYSSGDGGYKDEDGYVFVMGRTDDVINVAGHRLSTGEMEAVVAAHPAIAECAVIGVHDDLKGQVPIGLVVLKDGVSIDNGTLHNDLVQMIRHDIGPIACFKQAVTVERLPKTRSGKILRNTLRQIAASQPYTVPSTIDDPASLTEITAVMEQHQMIQAEAC
ncbi:propionyl-CoA synthetase [Aestuariibacter halophilus]|uniref:Propionyl-CoA synthetase n=1 Tax=Fluctibacter halophilus TaxID=226011 RepID=A0ABS8GD59_9ALTE|nr:propionyl-CoA synthetase [Aestuariibacter halophilus]MCC2617724.1 propionyl-CoA synthetase [Aestuariibacter halophilus]